MGRLVDIGDFSSGRRPIIGVIGASDADAPILAIAEEVGAAIGQRGWHLLTGGGGGVMAAAGQGFLKGRGDRGGISLGILPWEESAMANDYVEVPIPTGMGFARNAIVARASDGLIAVSGCSGTLSEIAFGWQFGRPIAAMSPSGGWSERLAGERLDTRFNEPIFNATSADEAVSYIEGRLTATEK